MTCFSKATSKTICKTKKATCFYDGECPICRIEINNLQKLDKANAINWVDITDNEQALKTAGITYQQAMEKIHVLDDQQQIVTGVKGFLTVWQHLSYYRRMVPVINYFPFLLSTMDAIYHLFARYRLILTGRTIQKIEVK